MPRPRKTRSKARAAATKGARKHAASASGAAVFRCPECGKEFPRAASLGAHRRRAHGVPSPTARNGRPRADDSSGTTVDRDALLQVLFPNGIPARERVIRDANAWLDQAERLARET